MTMCQNLEPTHDADWLHESLQYPCCHTRVSNARGQTTRSFATTSLGYLDIPCATWYGLGAGLGRFTSQQFDTRLCTYSAKEDQQADAQTGSCPSTMHHPKYLQVRLTTSSSMSAARS